MILLVGNGFTSQLIPEYKNDHMMDLFRNKSGGLLDKADELFGPLRYKDESGLEFYLESQEFVEHIKLKLMEIGFTNNNEIYHEFFIEYSLANEIIKRNITSIENLLKVIAMFKKIGKFSDANVKEATMLANEIYYNEGKIRAKDISGCSEKALREWLTEYQEIYTTNYDVILDDIYSNDSKRVYHLHGGFQFQKDGLKSAQPFTNWKRAYLVWGINWESKLRQITKVGGMTFNKWSFPMIFKGFDLRLYLRALGNSNSGEIHIFGYSGENDRHIDYTIAINPHIDKIIYFCDPQKTNCSHLKQRVNKSFNSTGKKTVILRSWNDVWDLIRQ